MCIKDELSNAYNLNENSNLYAVTMKYYSRHARTKWYLHRTSRLQYDPQWKTLFSFRQGILTIEKGYKK